MATKATIEGNKPGRTFYGIGGVTSNGMTKLLHEYPEAQRSDILDLLFTPHYGASFHHLKVEIGSDANGTCGTEPSHMRSSDDFDITRGVGLWMATEAKKRNSSITLDAIRWGTPAWLTDNSKKYLYYKNFLQGAKDKFGLDFDYLAPDENEGSFSRGWVVNTLRPGLDKDGFQNVKLTGADSTTDWNIASQVSSDSTLKKALFAINAHYKQDSPSEAKNCGLPIFDSEDIVAYRNTFDSALSMAYKMIRSYASGRMVQYVMHPVIEAIYDNVPYTYKGIIAASRPWTGNYEIAPSLWVVAQFTQFIQPGWVYIDSGCHTDTEHSYLTLKDPSTGDFSIILLNRSAEAETFTLTLHDLSAATLHAWQTTEAAQFVRLDDLNITNGVVTITLPANAITTLTTTTGQQKGSPEHGIPAETTFPLPYTDDFDSYEVGKQPRYTVDQSGAFEIAEGGENGTQCLRQIITKATKPTDWERRATPSPYTILGGQELTNYQAGFDFLMEDITDADYEGYVLLGVRCNFSPTGNVPAECYNLRLFHDGRWELRSAALVLRSGIATAFSLNTWHTLKMACKNQTIEAYLDGTLLATVNDGEYPSGHVVIGSGYNHVRFDHFTIEAIDASNPVECLRFKEIDPHISYIGSWKQSGSNAKNYHRTLLTTDAAGDEMDFTFNGTAVSILGVKDVGCGKADVYVDDSLEETIDTYADSTKYRKGLFSKSGLASGDHTVRLIVRGDHGTDATGNTINIDAVETIGGNGLKAFSPAPISLQTVGDTTLFATDFANEKTGSTPKGWNTSTPTSTSCTIVEKDGRPAICLKDSNSSKACEATYSIQPAGKRLALSFDYLTAETGKWFRLFALQDTASAIELYDSNVNGLCYRNANASDVAIQTIKANTWYHIKLDIDLTRQVFHVYVDDVLRKTDCQFRHAVDAINGIKIASGGSFKGQAWFTNFKAAVEAPLADTFGDRAIGSQPEDWQLVIPSQTSCTIERDSEGNCVVLSDQNSASQVSMAKSFARQDGISIVSFAMQDSAAGTWSRVILSQGTTNAIELYNSDLAGLCYRAQDGSYITIKDPEPGIWYHVKLAVDASRKRFDVYIDGNLAACGCAFRNVVPGIDHLTLASGEHYTGTTRFKDVRIEQGASTNA